MLKLPRRRFLHFVASAVALPALSRLASAQAYSSRPVRLLVGYAAGGAADILARLMGQWLLERFGQPFVVENRTGAGSNIAAEMLVRSPPVFTGVCPGERLNEILFAREEPMTEIGIPGIVAAKPVSPSIEAMRGWLLTLERGLSRDERDAIDRVLRDAVPDFNGVAA